MDIRRNLYYREGGEAQGGCGCTIPGTVQSQAGHSLHQPGLAGGAGQGIGRGAFQPLNSVSPCWGGPQSDAASLAGLCGGTPAFGTPRGRARGGTNHLEGIFSSPFAAAGARRGVRRAAAPTLSTRTPGRHFLPSHPSPSVPAPPLRVRGGRGSVRACATPPLYKGGSGRCRRRRIAEGHGGRAMARPLILGLLSLLGLLGAGKRCPAPPQPLPRPA